MSKHINKLANLFSLSKYEGQPPRRLYFIYSVIVGLIGAIIMTLAEIYDYPQLARWSKLITVLLLTYSALVVVINDSLVFLLHVENVIKSLICLTILLLLRKLALNGYGEINAYELCLTTLFSVFGRKRFFKWLITQRPPRSFSQAAQPKAERGV